MTDDLTLPAFLVRERGPIRMPVQRHKRMLPVRPEGSKWEAAERWEICVPDEYFGALAPGYRCIYQPGHKWAELRDAEAYGKVRAAEWERVSNKGRKISS